MEGAGLGGRGGTLAAIYARDILACFCWISETNQTAETRKRHRPYFSKKNKLKYCLLAGLPEDSACFATLSRES